MCGNKTVRRVNIASGELIRLLGPIAAAAKVDLEDVIEVTFDAGGIDLAVLAGVGEDNDTARVDTIRLHVNDQAVY